MRVCVYTPVNVYVCTRLRVCSYRTAVLACQRALYARASVPWRAPRDSRGAFLPTTYLYGPKYPEGGVMPLRARWSGRDRQRAAPRRRFLGRRIPVQGHMIREVKKNLIGTLVRGSEREREGASSSEALLREAADGCRYYRYRGEPVLGQMIREINKRMRPLELPPKAVKALVDPRSEIPHPLPFDALIPKFHIRVVAYSPRLLRAPSRTCQVLLWVLPASVARGCPRSARFSGLSQEPDEASGPSGPAPLRK